MYHRSVFCVFFILFFVFIFQQANAQCGNFGYTSPNIIYNSTDNLVTSKSQVFNIGVIGSFAVVGVVLSMTNVLALALEFINNSTLILPDVRLQYQYMEVSASESISLTKTNSAISYDGIKAMIGGAGVPETKVAQLLCRLNNVPQLVPLSFSASLTNKADMPMLGRLFPQATVHCKAIVQYIRSQGWKQFVLLYTDDDAGSSAYQIMGSTAAAYNLSLHPFLISSATKNYTNYVAQLSTLANNNRLRVFVHYVIVNNTSFYGSMASGGIMNNPKYVNILAYNIASFVGVNYKAWSTWVNGTIGIVPRGGNGPVYDDMMQQWNIRRAANPALDADPQINWYFFDSLYAIAKALDNAMMHTGITNASLITGKTLMAEIKNVTFMGVTGNVTFDSDVERNGDLSFMNFGQQGTQSISASFGYYSYLNDTVVMYRTPQYSQLATHVGDGVCPCLFGDCIGDTDECQCFEGFTGDICDIHNPSSSFSTKNKIVVIVVPVVAVVIMGIVASWYVKAKRVSTIKEVSQRQRSNINRSDIVLAAAIGRGASGIVYRATFRGTEVAVKQILTEAVSREAVTEFELESAVMASLRHPNIVIFMGACIVPAQKEMLLVMEFMDKGSLNDVIHNPQINVSFELGLHIAYQAAKGMNFLHQSSPPIIHRDLKSHNILLDDKWNAKIADFGIALIKENTKKKQEMKSIGTVYWTAPEVLEGSSHTEKSDSYSFGVVLWEIVHHINPYINKDPMAVAVGVTMHKLRPAITAAIPGPYKELIEKCWAQSPDDRPNFLEITQSLRQLCTAYPLLSYQAQSVNTEAPIGVAYFVQTNVTGGNLLWDKVPNDMEAAMTLHNQLIREKVVNFGGYEVEFSENGFLLAFETPANALNFCRNVQHSLMCVEWSNAICSQPYASSVEDVTGARVWNGLRVQMGINSGVSNSSIDEHTNKTIYFGPVVEKTKKLLSLSTGSILVSASVMDSVVHLPKFTEEYTHTVVGKLDGSDVHSVLPNSLLSRNATKEDLPHMILDIDEPTTTYLPPSDEKLSWIVKRDQLNIKESIGKGAIGDYYSATLSGKEVAVKVLVNQRLGESDLLHLKARVSVLTKLKHKNLLDVYGVCFEPGHISLILEYMPNCSLNHILANDSISLSWPTKLKIAKQIAEAMMFLSQFPDNDLNTHGNLKSGNILVNTSKMEVKVTDHGQSSLKDLARTMTSVGTVAWTAPEILNGEEVTPAITKYSYGIVLFEIATRKLPYPASEHPVKLVTKILKGYRPSNPGDCPYGYVELMEACWSGTPQSRPTWAHVINELDNMIAVTK